MPKKLMLTLVLLTAPSLASAQTLGSGGRSPGDATDIYKVLRETEQMKRDGRWQRLMAGGRVDLPAYQGPRQAARPAPPVATGSVRRRP